MTTPALISTNALERPLVPSLKAALAFGTKMQEHISECGNWVLGDVLKAREWRNRWLSIFDEADRARCALGIEIIERRVDPEMASAMVGAMFDAVGAKWDEKLLAGILDMISADEIGAMTGLWEPLKLSPAMLALGCRKAAYTLKFNIKPADVRECFIEARSCMVRAKRAAEDICRFVVRCDAVLLQFDHSEWERPYQTPEYRALLPRMLTLHELEISLDRQHLLDVYELAKRHGRPLPTLVPPLEPLVRAEQAKLALPAPTDPPRLAACAVKKAKKRTRKAKSDGDA
jgi:hypothetical protein